MLRGVKKRGSAERALGSAERALDPQLALETVSKGGGGAAHRDLLLATQVIAPSSPDASKLPILSQKTLQNFTSEEKESRDPPPLFSPLVGRVPVGLSDEKEGKHTLVCETTHPPFVMGDPWEVNQLRASADEAPSSPSSASPGLLSIGNSTALVPRILSYNVNGLSYYATDPDGVHRKNLASQAVSDFVPKCDIICLQETNLTHTERLCFSSLPGCVVSYNSLRRGVAGTLIIDTPAVLKFYQPHDVSLPLHCGGYVQCRRYVPRTVTHKAFQIVNCYFFTGPDKFAVQANLIDSIRTLGNSVPTFMCGDFNFIPSIGDTSSLKPILPPATFLEKFESLREFLDVSEVPHSDHTYFHLMAEVGNSHSHSSRLDRFYVPSSLSHSPVFDPSVSIMPHSTNYRLGNPSGIRARFSDHLPILLSFTAEVVDQGSRPCIPPWLARSPEFVAALREAWLPPTDSKSPFVKLAKFKNALFKAASKARKTRFEHASAPLRLSQHLSLLRLITVFDQDLTRIYSILSRAPSLLDLVTFRGGRFWDNGLDCASRVLLVSASGPPPSAPAPHPITTLKDKLPGSKARIPHLREEQADPPCFAEAGKSSIAAKFWSRVWAPRAFVVSGAERESFLAGYSKKVSSPIPAPSLEDVTEAVESSNNSSPGPDGIPFAAWRAAPDLACPLLFNAFNKICEGQPPPSGFNFGLLFLIPKKPSGLVSDTRPISVTNTDNRLLASVVSHSIMPAVSELVDPSQRGFLAGKNGHEHTLKINEFFFQGVKQNIQRLCFFLDTAKAFDSIDHSWALRVLSKAGFPSWLLAFVRGSLHDVKVSPCFGRSLVEWIDIRRGVKQGCPLSPLIFILAYDPLLDALSKLKNLDLYAFADDLAITALCVEDIAPALRIIDLFSSLSGLGVNKDKSCVISSGPPDSLDALRHSLLVCPWKDLPLRSHATHLGIKIGRDITLGDIFEGPYNKAVARISSCRPVVRSLPISGRILFVNTFIISLFSYHSLFFVIPKEYSTSIRGLVSKLVTPFNGGAYTYDSLLCLNFVYSIRPALKDLWAFNVSLLAARSPFISTSDKYNTLPAISIVRSKFIRDHRDAAAIDFWGGRHLDDNTLTPLPKCDSSSIYQALVEDIYLQKAVEHCGDKIVKFIKHNFPGSPPPSPFCVGEISKAMAYAAKSSPSSFLLHHFSLINNALATSRRMRHQNSLSVAQVARCFFCNESEDSLTHIYCWCPVVHSARVSFFHQQGCTGKLVSLFASFTAPLPSCLPFPLCVSFLIDVPLDLVNPLLAFNFAVWKFRSPSLGTTAELDNVWRSARIAELAFTCLRRLKMPKKSGKISTDDSIASHDAILSSAPPNSLVCYTDGSASPNPGPAGSGASIFNASSATVTDLGVNLGFGTNNLGELVAIGACLEEILSSFLPLTPRPTHAFIFTDSLFASNAVVSSKTPATHAATIKALRLLFSSVLKLVPVTFHWIRGHSGAGGNERVDRIAKRYAKLSVGSPAFPAPTTFTGHRSIMPWPFPIIDAPLQLFLHNLPKASPSPSALRTPETPLALASELDRPAAARSHSMHLRERSSAPSPPVLSPPSVAPLPVPLHRSPVARLFERMRISALHPVCVPIMTPPVAQRRGRGRPPAVLVSSDSDSDHVDRKHSE
jgi:ribonuclease HI/exonuclease III